MLSNQKQAVDGKLTAAAIDTLPGCNAQEVQTETSGGDSLQIVERTPSEKHDGNIAMGFDTGASNSKSNGAGIVIEMLGSFDSVGTVGEELSKIAPNEEIRHKLIEDTVIEMGGALQHKEIETDKTMELDEPDIGELNEPDIGELDEPDIGELDEPDIGELDEPDIGELGEPDIGGLDEPDIGDNRKGGEESGDERMEGEGSKLRGNQEQSDVCQNEGDIINGHNDSKEPSKRSYAEPMAIQLSCIFKAARLLNYIHKDRQQITLNNLKYFVKSCSGPSCGCTYCDRLSREVALILFDDDFICSYVHKQVYITAQYI